MPGAERPRDTRSRRVRRCLRHFIAHLFSNLGLFSLVVGYVLLGALLFEFLEADNEKDQRLVIQRKRDDCLRELWQITESLNVLYERNWTRLVHAELRKFETDVVEATRVEGYDGKDMDMHQWSFSGALLYSVTVITTIGYGNLAPRTSGGKVVTMVYALIGVPLMLLCLSNLGSLLADTFQFAYAQACCCHAGPPPGKHPHHRYDKHLQAGHTCSRHASRAPSYASQASVAHDAASTVVEINRAEPARNATILNNGGRPRLSHAHRSRQMRPMPSEVRNLLTECAEYSVQQDSADKSTVKLLRQLKEPDSGDEKANDNDEEEEDADDADLGLGAAGPHNTPSRVPLIWRSESQISKRPPTPPPRRARSETPTDDGHLPEHPYTSGRRGDGSVRVPISIVLLVLVGYICLGAAGFAYVEGWGFLDGAYFCFITLSTIGFGDLVPGKSFHKVQTPNGQLELIACCAYLILGLVLIAMSFTLVQEEVLDKCKQVALMIGILKRRDPH